MASMEPLLICCLIAQSSRKKGSPTVSLRSRQKSRVNNQRCGYCFLIKRASYNWAMPHLEVAVHADRHPVGQHFLHNGLSAAQHQFGVLGSRSINQVHQQILHDTGVVLQLSMKSDGEQRRQAASKGWENRLAEETDERKQAHSNMPCQYVWSLEI